jgi:hypothetical protein
MMASLRNVARSAAARTLLEHTYMSVTLKGKMLAQSRQPTTACMAKMATGSQNQRHL